MKDKKPPIVGQGATIYVGSDRYAYEVLEVSKDRKSCLLQRYELKYKEGSTYYGNQEYIYDETTLNGGLTKLKFRYGQWYIESEGIEFVDYEPLTKEQFKACYDEEYNLLLIPGITQLVKSYSKVSISFGVKNSYQDPHF